MEPRHHTSCRIVLTPRVSKMASKMGLEPGWSLDLTTNEPDDDQPRDFSYMDKRNKAKTWLRRDKPYMLVTGPMCGPFSAPQALSNYPKLDDKEIEKKLKAAT